MSWPSIADISTGVNNGQLKATDMVDKALKTIAEKSDFQAIISIIAERAKSRAEQIDETVRNGQSAGRLAGVPFIAKDNFLTFGSETTAASNILKGFNAPYQAESIERLEAEGAICVAKANLDAFAHGSSTENSDFMTTKNPHDPIRVPGGSSGGSTAAVILDMVPFALGTDTGGSIRLPAAFCGAVGFKPTYGLVSRSGVVAMASSTDVIGPITKTVADAGLILDVMSGKDQFDATTIDKDQAGYLPDSAVDFGKIKVGVIKEYFDNGLDPEVKKSVERAIDKLKSAGATIESVSLPSLPLALAVYYIVCPAEVSSNLSRYDGQRFGYRDQGATNLEESYQLSRANGFGTEAKRRIMIGTYVLSSGYYDAYYKKAQTVRTKIINEFNQTFQNFDILVGPTAPMTAFKIGENSEDPLKMYLTDIMTVAANMAGVPAISLPIDPANNMPVGFQIIAKQGNDRQLLQISKQFEEII